MQAVPRMSQLLGPGVTTEDKPRLGPGMVLAGTMSALLQVAVQVNETHEH